MLILFNLFNEKFETKINVLNSKGHSSLLCMEDCKRLVSSCVEWARASLSAAALCARLAPPRHAAPCVSLRDFLAPSQLFFLLLKGWICFGNSFALLRLISEAIHFDALKMQKLRKHEKYIQQ